MKEEETKVILEALDTYIRNFRGKTFQIYLHNNEILSIQINDFQFVKLLGLTRLFKMPIDRKTYYIKMITRKISDNSNNIGFDAIAITLRKCKEFIRLNDLKLNNIHSVVYKDKHPKVYANLVIINENSKMLLPLFKRDINFVQKEGKSMYACTPAGFNRITDLYDVLENSQITFPEKIITIGSRVNDDYITPEEIENKNKKLDSFKYIDEDIEKFINVYKKTGLQ